MLEYKIGYSINLQLFAEGEKTEEATPRRREESRKKGQVAKSPDLAQTATLLVGIIVLKIMFKFMYKMLYVNFKNSFYNMDITKFTIEKLEEIFLKDALLFFIVISPILLAILISGVLANYIQVGFLFTTEPLKPSFSKINPISGLKNMFSLKKLVELIKTIIKLIIIGIYGYSVVKSNYNSILKIPFLNFFDGFILIFKIVYDVVLKIAMALFVLAVVDYFYQKWEYDKSLKMSKQEIKEEMKQTEGNPQLKAKMRAMQRDMIRRRMIEEVPKATVIITNPTHLSVALKYDNTMSAPVVIAKGADNIAFRIREIAKENDIPIVENKPLARALYKSVEIGDEVPEEYYKAVATILQHIYYN
ncbi:flagellar biosynthesis protein FlhB [Haliovirga abyssi]|uniref:Flagellar biosynthetic protein FlhB n=1 Tax=Haliovirga abyssi TaxID=2996794 RepID=A0AAU9DFG7_9FUSO|nr:flagellar biosynthesis protein FlhB [Haliovirga abyssi]BDU50122.1 hypothetical protein HLVA_06910 [Haliovirga abyssi]